jgi:hypothetical protein
MAQVAEQIDKKHERLNSLYTIVDAAGKSVTFQFNDVQERLYHNLHDWNITLKSRQHGITTFFCIFGLDTAIHVPNIHVGIIAHNREDAERFFRDKIKYAWDKLDEGYKNRLGVSSEQSSTKELTFSNGSSIRVGTSLRSATNHILHISEFGKICARYPDKAREVVTGALNTVHEGALVSIESTAEGRAGYFYDYCQEAEKLHRSKRQLTRMDWKFHFFPWYQDPKNLLSAEFVVPMRLVEYFAKLQAKHGIRLTKAQKAWYTAKEAVLGEDMLREYPSTPEEAFHQSVEGAYFKTQFNKIYNDNRIIPVPVDEGLPVHTFWDLGVSDSTCIWFGQEYGRGIQFVDYYSNSGEGLAHYVNALREKKYNYGRHYGPHDIEVRDFSTGKTRKDIAAEMGLKFDVAPKLAKADQIEAARRLLGVSVFDESRCEEGLTALEAYRKEWDDKRGCWKDSPLHDWASHPADAFMVAAVVKIPRVAYSPQKQKVPVQEVPSY